MRFSDFFKKIIVFYLKKIKKLTISSRIIRFACKKFKDRELLVDSDKEITYSFRDLKERGDRLIHFLYGKGLIPGDVLGVMRCNAFEYFELRTAAHLGGFTFFSIPYYLLCENVIYFLNILKAKVFFYRGSDKLNIAKIKKEALFVEYFIDLDSVYYREIFSKEFNTYNKCKKVSPEPDFVATLNLSSGTTRDIPKAVQIPDKSWVSSLYNYVINSDIKVDSKMRFLCVLPFSTAGSTTFLPSLLSGTTHIIVREDFSPQIVANCIYNYRVNCLYITPSWFLELFEWCELNGERFSTLERIILGTEIMPSPRLEEAITFFGPIFYIGYGMVEVLPPITLLSPQDYHRRGKIKGDLLKSAGKVLKGVKIKIVNNEGKEISLGRVGKIAIKSDTISKGYLNNFEENSKRFKEGWFYTDDYGFLDSYGFLYFLGREEDIIVRDKELIFAREIEEIFYELPFIKQCAVIKKDNELFLFVSLRRKVDKKEVVTKLTKFWEENLSNYPFPRNIFIKDGLPISFLGKLDKKRLKEEMKILD